MRQLRLRIVNDTPGDFLRGTTHLAFRILIPIKPHCLSEWVTDLRACHLIGGQRSRDIKLLGNNKQQDLKSEQSLHIRVSFSFDLKTHNSEKCGPQNTVSSPTKTPPPNPWRGGRWGVLPSEVADGVVNQLSWAGRLIWDHPGGLPQRNHGTREEAVLPGTEPWAAPPPPKPGPPVWWYSGASPLGSD